MFLASSRMCLGNMNFAAVLIMLSVTLILETFKTNFSKPLKASSEAFAKFKTPSETLRSKPAIVAAKSSPRAVTIALYIAGLELKYLSALVLNLLN